MAMAAWDARLLATLSSRSENGSASRRPKSRTPKTAPGRDITGSAMQFSSDILWATVLIQASLVSEGEWPSPEQRSSFFQVNCSPSMSACSPSSALASAIGNARSATECERARPPSAFGGHAFREEDTDIGAAQVRARFHDGGQQGVQIQLGGENLADVIQQFDLGLRGLFAHVGFVFCRPRPGAFPGCNALLRTAGRARARRRGLR